MTRAEKARAMRYKKPALATMGYQAIRDELYEMTEACSDVHYFMDQDDETLLNALDGDEEEAFEFRLTFSMLENQAEELLEAIGNHCEDDEFDTYTVALIGNRYQMVGFDDFEEDYYSLCSYEDELAYTEAGKRLCRKTKAEIISTVGQCLGILLAFLDLRQRYEGLKAAIDVLRGENNSLLKAVKEIEALYDEAEAKDFRDRERATRLLDNALMGLPERMWAE